MITAEMKVAEVLTRYPQTLQVFQNHGLPCNECQMSSMESIESGARVHQADLEKLLADLNRAIA